MTATLINEIEVTTVQVVVLFEATLDISTIRNSKFLVYINTATPTLVSDPFETIVIADDYNSIAKILTLTWAEDILLPDTDYKIVFTGLEQPDGTVMADVEVTFTTGASVTAAASELPTAATPVTIIDHSLISDVFTTAVISPSSLTFSVLSSDPSNGEYYLEEDYENGRVIIKFTERPDLIYLASPYIKVQRKAIQRAPARWETLAANISLDTNKPWVYVDFPSIDHYPEAATPAEDTVYVTDDYSYYEPNYKYRIIVSKDLAT